MSKSCSKNVAYEICAESVADTAEIETLTNTVFGPGMKARAAYALRERMNHEIDLSFVAKTAGKIIGSVRITKIAVANEYVLMLGPLGVLPSHKNVGIGKALMETAVAASKEQASARGVTALLLVGDHAYYAPFGFERIPFGNITMPRPVDPARILACKLVDGDCEPVKGAARSLGEL